MFDILYIVPLISPRSSLVFNLSIFSFQSFESSFSMQEESIKIKKQVLKLLHMYLVSIKILQIQKAVEFMEKFCYSKMIKAIFCCCCFNPRIQTIIFHYLL